MRNPRTSLVFGCLLAALAASVPAVPLPYYAIGASAAILLLLIAWVVTLAGPARGRRR